MKQNPAKAMVHCRLSISQASRSPPFPHFNVGWEKLTSSEFNNIETGERGLFHLLLAGIVWRPVQIWNNAMFSKREALVGEIIVNNIICKMGIGYRGTKGEGAVFMKMKMY